MSQKDLIIENLLTAKAKIDNTIDLNAYVKGLEEMYDALFPAEIKKVKKERKSDIRVRIEQALKGVKIDNVFTDATSPAKNKYRMKLSCKQGSLTPLRKQLIESIPGVIKVTYKFDQNGRGYGFFSGICVYLNQKPSDIKL